MTRDFSKLGYTNNLHNLTLLKVIQSHGKVMLNHGENTQSQGKVIAKSPQQMEMVPRKIAGKISRSAAWKFRDMPAEEASSLRTRPSFINRLKSEDVDGWNEFYRVY